MTVDRQAIAEVLRKQAQSMGRLPPTEGEIDAFISALCSPRLTPTMEELIELEKAIARVTRPQVKRFDRTNPTRRKGRGREKRQK